MNTPEDDWRPWAPETLTRTPEPVPELGCCARCQRINTQPDRPSDWVEGLDSCAYIAGLICPDCITPDERQKLNALELEELVNGHTTYGVGIFINPADSDDAPSE